MTMTNEELLRQSAEAAILSMLGKTHAVIGVTEGGRVLIDRVLPPTPAETRWVELCAAISGKPPLAPVERCSVPKAVIAVARKAREARK